MNNNNNIDIESRHIIEDQNEIIHIRDIHKFTNNIKYLSILDILFTIFYYNFFPWTTIFTICNIAGYFATKYQNKTYIILYTIYTFLTIGYRIYLVILSPINILFFSVLAVSNSMILYTLLCSLWFELERIEKLEL